MNRRKFITNTALSVPLLSFPAVLRSQTVSGKNELKIIKPRKLSEGDTIGLIAPGSPISKEDLEESIESVESLGFKPYYTDTILDKYGYLGGKDKDRAEDINHMFANPDVDGIVCARGGYGCNRILPMLDYEMIRNNPKVLVGYSDITALLYALYAQAGLVSFHGPVGISTFNEFSVDYMKRLLTTSDKNYDLVSADEDQEKDDEAYKIYTVSEGAAEGELIGGNLTIAASLLGTPYDVDYKNKIVFLEDIGEEPYRIDRMLTELLLAGKLQDAAGVALGVFVDCAVDEEDPEYENSLSLKQVFEDRLGSLGIPVIHGLSFGHITNKFTLPFGTKAKLDTNKEAITLLESSVD